ncbi:MAG: FKBP-type peptidyl-prolyl cis-trans isomerase [Candidatus ainarchaeum sp.]|nr:FKBP-type peptidyl-prolyl cis-trans isomerase [Candidatus ainarchaeum sp.]
MKNWIVLILATLLLFGCVNPPQPPANVTGPPPVMNNATPAANATLKPIPADSSVDVGDTVWADYTLRVDGKVTDTSNATLANESGIYSRMRAYEPFEFEVQFNKGLIDGFIIGVIGMRVNETQTFYVDPARGYGPYDPAKVIKVQRYYNTSLYETIPASYFIQQGITNLTTGTTFSTSSGIMTSVFNISGDNVTLFYILQKGQKVSYAGVPATVLSVHNYTAVLEYDLQENMTYSLPNPSTGVPTRYTVIGKDNDSITLDGNHQLANKTLEFTVTVVRAERPS